MRMPSSGETGDDDGRERDELVPVVGLSGWTAEIAREAGFLVSVAADREPDAPGDDAERDDVGDE